ncbi:hypothetical protein SAMN05660350_00673 [Geodermatophilus obscurus]|uniref:Uncharacterized protein n=1 Tax=Geodermatophilus obscurus TaxID=1861 RepID=A0A1M7SCW5_9ACTN|nr:hypothetical protein [Geodermatophilus obscurus]SHN56345.1 hypothetical protein SAMN05660350_00673 [Geodermatophilus obscurus]
MRCTAGQNGEVQILATGPDDEHFAAWCEVWAATQCADRPDEREHRGHRLGARIKVAVLREVAATLPAVRRISSYNADANRPMVAVNEALGFRRAGGLSTWLRRI